MLFNNKCVGVNNMEFAAKPENIFADFIDVYYTECTERFPKIEAICGKWEFRDLIPGMSDFDTRFLCSDTMTAEDWCQMSQAVGEVHLELCKDHPEWSRILEHLPGVNPTWEEYLDEDSYYPEYAQWSIYRTTQEMKAHRAERAMQTRGWDERDEYFFLKKFLTYYGKYNRKIDPPINLGRFENKYPLHSRIMHYFTPPVQAAVSLIERRTCRGKFEALEKASSIFPELDIFKEVLAVVEQHYEVPQLYEEPELKKLEDRMEKALQTMFLTVKDAIHIFPLTQDVQTAADIKKMLSSINISPVMQIFDSCRFCRLFKGRLYFYSNAPKHFDNIWLIKNELSRAGEMFFRGPYRIYWQAVYGEKLDDPLRVLHTLSPDILTKQEVEATRRFAELTPGTWESGREVAIAEEIVDIFDNVFKGLYKLNADLKSRMKNVVG